MKPPIQYFINIDSNQPNNDTIYHEGKIVYHSNWEKEQYEYSVFLNILIVWFNKTKLSQEYFKRHVQIKNTRQQKSSFFAITKLYLLFCLLVLAYAKKIEWSFFGAVYLIIEASSFIAPFIWCFICWSFKKLTNTTKHIFKC